MCGIYGYFNITPQSFNNNLTAFKILSKESYSRGKEASGAACLNNNGEINIIKSDLDSKKLYNTIEFQDFVNHQKSDLTICSIGHSRLATHGTQLNSENNQPVVSSNIGIVGIHNGIITNPDQIWSAAGKMGPSPILDTSALIEYYEKLSLLYSVEKCHHLLYSSIEGSASLAILDAQKKSLYLSSNTGSLFYIINPNETSLFFASEKVFLEKITAEIKVDKKNINQIKPNHALKISCEGVFYFKIDSIEDISLNELETSHYKTKNINDFSAKQSQSSAKNFYSIINSIDNLKKHDFNYKDIYSIPRCSKCILPASTPFITFNTSGVCNFCEEHKPISYLGLDELKKVISKFKKNNGEPDCLAAFSGGRDSSYGLHFLKKELGLQPLAYTYDWGMVTDVARRNQARILGKLGVEHIVLSADITKKRKHIRENILAWMKDPHLGMVPLFMEGDKQCEYYADQKMKNYGLDLMFFFRGNELEKDEFKTGHCGVKDADPGGVIHNLEFAKKIKLLSFYASRYVKNPSYFNSSFFDTSLGFFSTYIQKHNYLYLWHYVPWDEKVIVDTLTKEYNWEYSSETSQTWRTDDGTSAFYNYIYYQVQGFTENDSFRSRQIREGIIDRETAIKLVNNENKPRYEALKWYFDMLGLDGDKVLTVVDKMKKYY